MARIGTDKKRVRTSGIFGCGSLIILLFLFRAIRVIRGQSLRCTPVPSLVGARGAKTGASALGYHEGDGFDINERIDKTCTNTLHCKVTGFYPSQGSEKMTKQRTAE